VTDTAAELGLWPPVRENYGVLLQMPPTLPSLSLLGTASAAVRGATSTSARGATAAASAASVGSSTPVVAGAPTLPEASKMLESLPCGKVRPRPPSRVLALHLAAPCAATLQ
jgi:hypothetical protein